MLAAQPVDFDAASRRCSSTLPAGDQHDPAVVTRARPAGVYLLDRRTGRQVRRSDAFVPLENIFPRPTLQGTRSSPGTRGGANWPPPAYSRVPG